MQNPLAKPVVNACYTKVTGWTVLEKSAIALAHHEVKCDPGSLLKDLQLFKTNWWNNDFVR